LALAGVALRAWSGSNDAQRGLLRHFASKWSRLRLPDPWFGAINDVGRCGKAPTRPVTAGGTRMRAVVPHTLRLRSQFWSQLAPFGGVRERSTGRFASVNGDMRISLDLGLRIWKAGWVQVLTSRVSCCPRLGPASSSRPHQEDQDPLSDGRPDSRRPWARVAFDVASGRITCRALLRTRILDGVHPDGTSSLRVRGGGNLGSL